MDCMVLVSELIGTGAAVGSFIVGLVVLRRKKEVKTQKKRTADLEEGTTEYPPK